MQSKLWSVLLLSSAAACSGGKAKTTGPVDEAKPTEPVAADTGAPAPEPVATTPVSTATETPPPPPTERTAPPIVVGAIKLTLSEKGKTETVELAADGTVKARGKVMGKFVGNEMQDATGKWMVRVKADGTLEARTVERTMKDGKVESEKESIETVGKFGESDVLDGPKGKVVLGDDGVVTVTKPGGKAEPVKEVKLSGVTRETRRAGLVLALATMMPGTVTTDMSNATAEPVAVPAPPKAPPATPKGPPAPPKAPPAPPAPKK
jgi:hypothetical protein